MPPKFDLRLSAAKAGSLQQAVAKSVVTALKAKGLTLDLSAPGALASVVAAFPAALTDLPQLRIATKHGAPILSKEVYVDATYVLTNPAAAVPDVALNGKIRGRGNSTWGQPKNPYKLQFSNDAGYAKITDVLGMKKQRNWALLADYFDRSLLRNKLALSLGSSSVFADGLKWTPSGQHVEVWLNDDYVGVYLLTEDIRIDPARLDIRKMSS
ncbi:MAG: CotH kinase family protein, partial [Betaproteobacteria bacterium]|nr:CotH kinase family protein [Betaproteobacteria bacterium]